MSNNIVFVAPPVFQSLLNNGQFNQGGFVYTYMPGSNTPVNSYSTVTDAQHGTNPNTNPVILDSRGSATIIVTGPTKIIVQDKSGNQISSSDNYNLTASNIYDSNGNALLLFSSQNNAVNQITIDNAVTGNPPILAATGSDLNIGLNINLTGNSTLNLNTGTGGLVSCQGAAQVANTLTVNQHTTTNGLIITNGLIAGSNTLTVQQINSVSSAVNNIKVSNATTTNPPIIQAIGTDTNVYLELQGQGNLGVLNQGSTAADTTPAGYIGELKTAANSLTVSNGVTTNVATLSLTAGHWILYGGIGTNIAGTSFYSGLSTTSGVLTTPFYVSLTTTGGVNPFLPVPPLPINVSSTTTVYLIINMVTSGNFTASGTINAIRYA